LHLQQVYLCFRPFLIEAFYLTPLPAPKGDIWYKQAPFGVHSIEKVVKRLIEQLGVDGFFTNTSLRRTATTRLVMDSGIPNKVAKKVTGKLEIEGFFGAVTYVF
jgi:hypothetical protein